MRLPESCTAHGPDRLPASERVCGTKRSVSAAVMARLFVPSGFFSAAVMARLFIPKIHFCGCFGPAIGAQKYFFCGCNGPATYPQNPFLRLFWPGYWGTKIFFLRL
jgi:hypothetical protein